MIYVLKLALIAAVTVLAALLTMAIGMLDPHGKRAYRIGRFWTWFILKVTGVSVQVRGLDRIDPARGYIFIANHQSNIDIPVLVQSLPGFQLRWIAKKELLRVPFFGWALRASKHITIDRANRTEAARSLAEAEEKLRAGISIVVFPEGTRSRTGALLPFKRGGFVLAVQTGTPIVPVTINGTGALLPAGAWRVRPGPVEVVIGEPVSAKRRVGAIRSLMAEVRAEIEKNLRPPPDKEVSAVPRRHPMEPLAGSSVRKAR
ncbi:MAG TPA: lysophospholipid acyltransferase family protein [candidate division Zixibacteria bacterium]|nr:lysophospholipid acyltransferase family protein [candidate division Zixibacteria bacterium]